MVAADASALYARNLLDFIKLIVTKEGTLNSEWKTTSSPRRSCAVTARSRAG